MAFSLDDHEGMATGLRRIAGEELAAAIDSLEGRGPDDRDAAVHDARKRLKKTRAVIRLARYDLGKKIQRTETAALRDAARRLSGVRDAHVLLATLEAVTKDAGRALPAAATAGLREALERRRDELQAAALDDEHALGEIIAEVGAVRARAGTWPLDDEGFGSAGRGLRRIHGRGRVAMQQALEGGDDEAWHDLRKRVKDLWYALRILAPVAPAQLQGMVDEADRLSDVLGDHNDIAVLREALDEHGSAVEPRHRELLIAALDRRRDELRAEALPLARRVYAERPKAFTRRLRAYWRARDAAAGPAVSARGSG